MGLYEIENFDNANICTIALNPKDFLKKKQKKIKKIDRSIKRDTPEMNFESYAERISFEGSRQRARK